MSNWTESDNKLTAKFELADFRQAFAFMTEVAFVAEELNHHPEWKNVYRTVWFELTTHDAGNTVTDMDRELARRVDAIYQRFN